MRMPVMDGYEATKKIRQLAGGEQVKIIALTASAFKEQHRRILEAGCDAILNKPFHVPEIFSALVNHLSVRFVYENEMSFTKLPHAELTHEMLLELPLEMRQRLYEAALILDIDEVENIIEQISAIAPELSEGLIELARNYQFEQITQLSNYL